jgi:hypothetical protein
MHVTSRDDADQSRLTAQREGDMQIPAVARATERVISWLSQTVPIIGNHKQLLAKEHLLRLSLADRMLVGTPPAVPSVPIEPFDACRTKHAAYMPAIYATRQDEQPCLHDFPWFVARNPGSRTTTGAAGDSSAPSTLS